MSSISVDSRYCAAQYSYPSSRSPYAMRSLPPSACLLAWKFAKTAKAKQEDLPKNVLYLHTFHRFPGVSYHSWILHSEPHFLCDSTPFISVVAP